MNTFKLPITHIQPSQLYISAAKLNSVQRRLDAGKSIDPITVKQLNSELIYTDGHTRAYAFFLAGYCELEVIWEPDEWDWDAYEICIQWCKHAGIYRISDLQNRVISASDYQRLWVDRCAKMHQALEKQRNILCKPKNSAKNTCGTT